MHQSISTQRRNIEREGVKHSMDGELGITCLVNRGEQMTRFSRTFGADIVV